MTKTDISLDEALWLFYDKNGWEDDEDKYDYLYLTLEADKHKMRTSGIFGRYAQTKNPALPRELAERTSNCSALALNKMSWANIIGSAVNAPAIPTHKTKKRVFATKKLALTYIFSMFNEQEQSTREERAFMRAMRDETLKLAGVKPGDERFEELVWRPSVKYGATRAAFQEYAQRSRDRFRNRRELPPLQYRGMGARNASSVEFGPMRDNLKKNLTEALGNVTFTFETMERAEVLGLGVADAVEKAEVMNLAKQADTQIIAETIAGVEGEAKFKQNEVAAMTREIMKARALKAKAMRKFAAKRASGEGQAEAVEAPAFRP